MNEQSLLNGLQAGDQNAMQAIFDAHYEMVCQIIYRYVQDPGLSEDLGQEVFIRLWEKRSRLQIDATLEGYLRRMATNEALAHIRKKTRFQAEELPIHLSDSLTTAQSDDVEVQDLNSAIVAAVDALPERCRLVFTLSRYEEMTYQEIAQELDISVKTVENQMGKALKTLRDKLSGWL